MIDCRETSEENKQRQQTNEGTRVYLGVDKKRVGRCNGERDEEEGKSSWTEKGIDISGRRQ